MMRAGAAVLCNSFLLVSPLPIDQALGMGGGRWPDCFYVGSPSHPFLYSLSTSNTQQDFYKKLQSCPNPPPHKRDLVLKKYEGTCH